MMALYEWGPQLSFALGGFGVIEMGVGDGTDPELDLTGAFLHLIEYEGRWSTAGKPASRSGGDRCQPSVFGLLSSWSSHAVVIAGK